MATWWDLSQLRMLGLEIKHPALTWMIIARVIQAVGGGAVVPIALASSAALFGQSRRSVALGFISGVTEAGGALGPLYGAIILEKWPFTWSLYPTPWMWLFLLNIPLVVVLCVMLWWSWPKNAEARDVDQVTNQGHARIDWLGAVVIGAALMFLSLGLSQQAGAMVKLSTDTVTGHNPYLLAVAGLLLVAFIIIEKRQEAPVVPLEFFRSMTFSASAVLSLLVGIVLIVALVNVPIFAYAVLSQSHLDAGLLLLRLTILIPLGAFISGWLVSRVGSRSVAAGAGVVTAIGFVFMSRWTPESTEWFLTLGTTVTGFGFGLSLAPISTTALQTVASSRFGVAAAISTSMRMIGMIFGLAALSSWEVRRFQQLFAELRAAPRPPGCLFECMAKRLETSLHTATSQAMAEAFLAAAVVSVVGVVVAMFLRATQGQKR